ncbi:MAG: hypothetical protein C5B59_06935 [Bacteroidetes bacterium]|nr:MAG: hypothetical protein C5B59_06935 [Bacteroidota bacterium]
MKKIISVAFSICFFAAMPNNSDAQAVAKNTVVVKSQSISEAMKLTEDSKNEVTEITSLSEVNQKAMRDFKKTFGHVDNEKWYLIKNGYLAEFSLNSIKNRVVYDKKGNWRFSVSYYGEKNLPAEIRAIVKPVYYDYAISRVEEVHSDDKVIYIVHVQNASTLKTLRVCEGEMDLIEDFRKSE